MSAFIAPTLPCRYAPKRSVKRAVKRTPPPKPKIGKARVFGGVLRARGVGERELALTEEHEPLEDLVAELRAEPRRRRRGLAELAEEHERADRRVEHDGALVRRRRRGPQRERPEPPCSARCSARPCPSPGRSRWARSPARLAQRAARLIGQRGARAARRHRYSPRAPERRSFAVTTASVAQAICSEEVLHRPDLTVRRRRETAGDLRVAPHDGVVVTAARALSEHHLEAFRDHRAGRAGPPRALVLGVLPAFSECAVGGVGLTVALGPDRRCSLDGIQRT